MKIKKNSESIGTGDFWYDLFLGGYFKPENYLTNKEDIDAINIAIHNINVYEQALIKAKKLEEM
jgi:hypothetical protein